MGIRGSRRRRTMTKQERKMKQSMASVDDHIDDLLELVLLGLDSAVCLTRAAATCKLWRRIVADADGAFLRRFRSLHAPPPVGHFYYAVDADPPCSFGISHTFPHEDPVFVPSSGHPGRRQQPSLDFVPSAGDGKRQVVDSRGSLLLLLYDEVRWRECASWRRRRSSYGDRTAPDLVVCEPLTRRYEKIVLPPNCDCVMSAFLLDGDDGEAAGCAISMDNFRVLLVLYESDRDDDDMDLDDDGWYRHGWPYTAVFSRGGSDGGIIECAVGDYDLDGVYLPNIEEVHLAGRAGGRVYWGCEDQQVIVLDERTLELFAMAHPDHVTSGFHSNNFRKINVDGGDMVRIVGITGCGDLEVRSYAERASDECEAEWVVEKRVELAEASLHLRGRKEEYFGCLPNIVTASECVVLSPAEETWLFSVDLHSMELEREHERNKYKGAKAYPCVPPWPPVMRACVGN